MNKSWVEMQLIALAPSVSQEGRYVLVLATVDGKRRLPIIVHKIEAEAIAVAVEGLQPKRPLAYDSWLNTLSIQGSTVDKVRIERIEESIFYAHLVLVDVAKTKNKIDVRPSDAVALAVRCHARIYTTEEVLMHASFQEGQLENLPAKGSLTDYSLAELEMLLEQLLAREDYQNAARIRDLMEQRKSV